MTPHRASHHLHHTNARVAGNPGRRNHIHSLPISGHLIPTNTLLQYENEIYGPRALRCVLSRAKRTREDRLAYTAQPRCLVSMTVLHIVRVMTMVVPQRKIASAHPHVSIPKESNEPHRVCLVLHPIPI